MTRRTPPPSAWRCSSARGGTYDANGLFARAGMLGELGQIVNLLSHDLQPLARAARE
jgi:hypothetical protein